MRISEGRLNHLEDRSKKLTKVQIKGSRMRLHLHALTVFVETGGTDLNEFAVQFPRTWNAIITDNPASFDLPIPVEASHPYHGVDSDPD